MSTWCLGAMRSAAAAIAIGAMALPSASAQTGQPIRIGLSLALTGAGAAPSKVINTALEMWRDDVNAKGGVLAVRSSWSSTTIKARRRTSRPSTPS